MSLGIWRTVDGIEIAEIIGGTKGWSTESTPTVRVTCTKTCATEFVDPPTRWERWLGITFAAKILRAIDKVRAGRHTAVTAQDERRAVCAGIAALLNAERAKT